MVRRSVMLLLVGLVLVGGCKKKEEGQANASSSGAAGETTGAAATNAGSGATGAQVDWAKVDRVPFSKLQTIFPESLPNELKRKDLGGSTNPDGEHTYTEATASYEGPKERVLNVHVRDNPLSAKEALASKTSAFQGYPIVAESESQGFSNLEFIVGERFTVTVSGQELKVAELKTSLEKVELAKLASWKDEGLKK